MRDNREEHMIRIAQSRTDNQRGSNFPGQAQIHQPDFAAYRVTYGHRSPTTLRRREWQNLLRSACRIHRPPRLDAVHGIPCRGRDKPVEVPRRRASEGNQEFERHSHGKRYKTANVSAISFGLSATTATGRSANSKPAVTGRCPPLPAWKWNRGSTNMPFLCRA